MKSAEEYYKKGREFAEKYNDEAALVCYDIAIDLKPDFAMAYNNRGIIRKALKDYEGAKQDFDRAIELNPQNVKAYLNRGNLNVYFDRKDALKDFDKALDLAPENVNALCDRGYYYAYIEKNGETARRDIEKAIAVAPDNSSGYYYRGILNMLENKWKEAVADFEKSIKLESGEKNYKAYALCANAAIEMERYFSAIIKLRHFVEVSPQPGQFKLKLFGVHRNLHTASDWIEQGRKFHNRSRLYTDIDTNLNSLFAIRACILLAKECFEQAMKLDKSFARIYNDTVCRKSKLSDYLTAIKKHGKMIKCPECGNGLNTDRPYAPHCETCGFSSGVQRNLLN